MWLDLSFDSNIIISWINRVTKIPRVTTTSNIKPKIHGPLCLSFFCCWTPHAFEQNGSIHDTCNFSFAFASFCYQKKKGNLHNYTEWKQHNVRQSDARNFKFTLYKMWQMLDLRQNDIRPGISICEPRSIDLVISL